MQDTIVIGGDMSLLNMLIGDMLLLNVITGDASLLNTIDGEYGKYVAVESDPHETYSGDYNITPKITTQVFDTNNKLMNDDITVVEIPYFETSNLDGGTTVYIANSIT